MSATIHYRDGDREEVHDVQINGAWVYVWKTGDSTPTRIVNGLLVDRIELTYK